MNDKVLSIIIPAYNSEKYIEECLKSLKLLLADELQIIVINDGSRDNTADIVEKYRQQDNRIELYTLKNGGVSKARNAGIERASGEYIMFLDADDYLISDAFSMITKVINDGNVDFAAFARDIVEMNGKIWQQKFPFEEDDSCDKEKADRVMYADSLLNECWGKIFKKSLIDKYSIRFPVDIPIGEDLMFVMEYYSKCNKVHLYNTSLVRYRQHKGSSMRKYSINDRLKFTEKIYSYTRKYVSEDFADDVLYYNFKVLTNLCREYSYGCADKSVIKKIYSCEMASDIMNKLNIRSVSLYKKHEYYLMKCKLFLLSAIYYRFKAYF